METGEAPASGVPTTAGARAKTVGRRRDELMILRSKKTSAPAPTGALAPTDDPMATADRVRTDDQIRVRRPDRGLSLV